MYPQINLKNAQTKLRKLYSLRSLTFYFRTYNISKIKLVQNVLINYPDLFLHLQTRVPLTKHLIQSQRTSFSPINSHRTKKTKKNGLLQKSNANYSWPQLSARQPAESVVPPEFANLRRRARSRAERIGPPAARSDRPTIYSRISRRRRSTQRGSTHFSRKPVSSRGTFTLNFLISPWI